jgi:hypothetical protein
LPVQSDTHDAVNRYLTHSRSVHHHLALVVVSYALAEYFHLSDLGETGVGPTNFLAVGDGEASTSNLTR